MRFAASSIECPQRCSSRDPGAGNHIIVGTRREPGSARVPFPGAKLPPLLADLLPKGRCGALQHEPTKVGRGDNLHERSEIERINQQEASTLDGACANRAQEFFGGLRRAEIGFHPDTAGACSLRHAQKSLRREDNKRVVNDDLVSARAGQPAAPLSPRELLIARNVPRGASTIPPFHQGGRRRGKYL